MATVHTIPIDDVVVHDLTEDCMCGPTPEMVPCRQGGDGWHYLHHSLDGREVDDRPRPDSWGNVVTSP